MYNQDVLTIALSTKLFFQWYNMQSIKVEKAAAIEGSINGPSTRVFNKANIVDKIRELVNTVQSLLKPRNIIPLNNTSCVID